MLYMKIKLVAFLSMFIIIFCGLRGLALSHSAKSVCLFDIVSGTVVYRFNADNKMLPASITKIVTAATALEMGMPDDIVTITEKSAGIEGSSIYLKVGEKIKLIDLIYGMMLHSGNDAATAIAEHFGYENFIMRMNNIAKKAGAKSSNFENPSGLDGKEHYVTAYDMALITAYALKNPSFLEVVSEKTKKITTEDGFTRQLKNHNKLLWLYEHSLGVKTGFTKKAGRTLVSYAKRNDRELICVTLNDPDDWNDHIKLYNNYLK